MVINVASQNMFPKIPVTILTGALGAGKTTLLQNIVKKLTDKKILIIENEFAAEGIDGQILESEKSQEDSSIEVVELNNGCICCNMRGDMVNSLLKVAKDGTAFDRVIIECTGLADPAALASSFAPLSILARKFVIDATLCLVDAKNHWVSQKNDNEIYVKQIIFSDIILVSKKDLVPEDEYNQVLEDIKKTHPDGKCIETLQGDVDIKNILELYCYSFCVSGRASGNKNNMPKNNMPTISTAINIMGKASTKTLSHNYQSHVLKFDGFFEKSKLEFFLNVFYLTHYEQVVRSKGIIHFKNVNAQILFQAVYGEFSFSYGESFKGEIQNVKNVLIFIGKDINQEYLEIGLRQCLVA